MGRRARDKGFTNAALRASAAARRAAEAAARAALQEADEEARTVAMSIYEFVRAGRPAHEAMLKANINLPLWVVGVTQYIAAQMTDALARSGTVERDAAQLVMAYFASQLQEVIAVGVTQFDEEHFRGWCEALREETPAPAASG